MPDFVSSPGITKLNKTWPYFQDLCLDGEREMYIKNYNAV